MLKSAHEITDCTCGVNITFMFAGLLPSVTLTTLMIGQSHPSMNTFGWTLVTNPLWIWAMSPKVTVITVELPETAIEHVGDLNMYLRVLASKRVPHKSDGELVKTNPFVGDW